MMAGEYTKGPWSVSGVRYRRDALDWRNISTDDDRKTLIATVVDIENPANAALIAAAPCLDSALQKLANEVGALRAFEHEVREAIGNTNFAILMQRLEEAEAPLQKARAQ